MAPEKIALAAEKETLLITLYGKARESRLPDSLLHDTFAAEAVDRIDYDFSRLRIDRDLMIGVAMRSHILDQWTRAFLAQHPAATVLHLGCGLDARVFRLDPGPEVRWFEVDYPAVVDLRRRLYPERAGCTLIGASATDPQWLAGVPADRPAMIVAEGVFPYVAAEEVPRLLDRLTAHFPSGEIAFDGYSRFGLKLIAWQPSIRATGAKLQWAFEDPHDLERQIPRLRLLTDLRAYDPDGYDPAQVARMSLPARITIGILRMIPALPTIGRLARYRF